MGEARRVTPRHVLRPADVPAAARALGITVPERVRTAADVSTLHRLWRIALTVGFLAIVDGHARPGPALQTWPGADDETVRGMWLAALPAAVAATSPDVDEADATICARVLLAKLAADPGAAPDEVRRFGREAVAEEPSEAVFRFFTGWYRLTSPSPRSPGLLGRARCRTARSHGSGAHPPGTLGSGRAAGPGARSDRQRAHRS